MKKVVLLAVATLFAFASFIYAQQLQPPADKMKIDLRQAWGVAKPTQKGVQYDHGIHLPKLEYKCEGCHSSPQGATKIKVPGEIKGANESNGAHKFCFGCHDTIPKPNKTPGKTCTKCHTLPK